MKKVKKLLVTLLVLTFVLSTVSVGFAADTTTADSSQSAEVVRAQALGILKGDEKGNLNLDQPITRAEALALIVRISGLESSAGLMAGQTKFTDVNSDAGLSWATGYINLGVGQSIVNGYPDGTFKGRNTVTYAEMAKLLLYAMNYGVTVEGAPWPAGVMGKADDLDIFDDVSPSPNVPATRGAVVKMIDNSLTVNHLKQTGYGDLTQYEEDEGTTFLSKMNVDEIDGRVTAVDVKDYEVTVEPIDDDQPIDSAETYTILDKTTDVESLLGVEATVWVNDDDEIFFIDPQMDDVKVDVISDVDNVENADGDPDEIELKIADDTYDLSQDVKVYINGESADLGDLDVDMYGSFVFDDDEILYINVKDWTDGDGVIAGLVESVEDDLITFYDGENESDIDLTDPNDGYVITLNGEAITPDDIEKNDVIYVADYDDMYHIVVVRDTVSGELERVKSDELRIAGETYDVNTAFATYSPNEDEDIYEYDVNDDELEDMLGEDTTAILDIAGDVRHLTSSVETTSDEFYGVLLKADDYNETVKVDVKGDSISYDVDADIHNATGADITVDASSSSSTVLEDEDFDLGDLQVLVNASDDKYAIVKFTVDSDGVIDEMWVYAFAEPFYDGEAGSTESDPDTSETGDITGWNVTPASAEIDIDSFDDDDDIIEADGGGDYFVDEDTIIIDELDDIDVVSWDNIKDKTASSTEAIIYDDDGDAKLVVFTAGFDSIQEEDKELGVVLDKFKDNDKDWAATVVTYNGEEADIKLDDSDAVSVGDTLSYTLDADNELTVEGVVYGEHPETVSGFTVVGGTVVDKSSSSIEIDGPDADEYKTSSKTIVVDVSDGDDVDFDGIDEAAYRDVREDDEVALVIENSLVKVIYILHQD